MNDHNHVIVTGGSRGLGLSIIKVLLDRGYLVSTCSRNMTEQLDQLRSDFNDQLFWQKCTVGNEEETTGFINSASAWSKQNQIYGLINNAGIAKQGILATFPNIDSEDIIQTNLIGAIQMARGVLRIMFAQNSPGRIINISSIIGSRGYTGLSAYSASKAGMDGLTRSLAREVGRKNITVNSIAPGYLTTDMSSTLSPNQQKQIIGRTPLGRLGTPEDITPIIKFLLSEDARFITGQCITIDGGITC